MIAQLNKEYIKTRPLKVISRLASYFFFEGRPLTTKGRCINPLLFFFYRLICVLPMIKKINSPIFIIGTGRSGSTLLGLILSIHKSVAFLNEPKALWHFAYDHEDIIGNYSQQNAYYRLNENNCTERTTLLIKKLYAFYLTSIFSKRVVDKYPEMIFRIEFIKKIFPDAKFLFLQRNAFYTCASTIKWIAEHQVKKKNEIQDWWGLNNRKWHLLVEQVVPLSKTLSPHINEIKRIASHLDRSAVEWIASMEEGLFYLKKYPDNVLPLKYEELIQNPETTLARIFLFCNLEPDEKSIAYAKRITKQNGKNNLESELPPYLRESIQLLMNQLGY